MKHTMFKDYAVVEDVNWKGLRKAKKGVTVEGSSKQVFEQQDKYCVRVPYCKNEKLALFCVFDGHAGAQCAEDATRVFPSVFAKKLKVAAAAGPVLDMKQVFLDSYKRTDKKLIKWQFEGCTSTTVCVWSVQGKIYCQSANVGDSTSFLCRGRDAIQLSVDHKPTLASEKERLRAEGIDISEHSTRLSGLAVSRALGDCYLKGQSAGLSAIPFVSPVYEIEEQDSFLILASDGLWDTITGQSAMDVLLIEATAKSAEAMATKLVRSAVASSLCCDNVCVIVVTFSHPKSQLEASDESSEDEGEDGDEDI